jgi:hypothetical protein
MEKIYIIYWLQRHETWRSDDTIDMYRKYSLEMSAGLIAYLD